LKDDDDDDDDVYGYVNGTGEVVKLQIDLDEWWSPNKDREVF
jgi:hypothetical protein